MEYISIIMPLFNAEKYLPEALESVLKQTYKDFELICIDDCSTDRTRGIIEEFQKKDARIRILINEERLGAAPSRNKGLKAAKGEYLLFLDGDDVFDEELLERASSAMGKYQADIVLFEYMHVPSETIYEKKVQKRPEDFADKYCKVPFAMKDFEPREFPWWPASPCNRILKRNFIQRNRLEFQNLPSKNDVYFAQMCLFCAEKIICLNDRRVMVYARDHSGPQRISNNIDPMCIYYALEKLCKELKERNMLSQYASYLYYRSLEYFLRAIAVEKDEERKKRFYDFLHKEGILQYVGYGREYYDQIDEYDKYLLDCFQNYIYESRWFEHRYTYFHFYLRKYGDVVFEFIRKQNLENKKIVLWGVGDNRGGGWILLDYLTARSIKIFGAVDCDEKKQGTIVNGYEILKPFPFCLEANYIIVTSNKIYQEVCIAVKDTGIVVINLLQMLRKMGFNN